MSAPFNDPLHTTVRDAIYEWENTEQVSINGVSTLSRRIVNALPPVYRAAPDPLAALLKTQASGGCCESANVGKPCDKSCPARAAIAKARGES